MNKKPTNGFSRFMIDLLLIALVSFVLSALLLTGFFAWFAEDPADFPPQLLVKFALGSTALITVVTLLLTKSKEGFKALRAHTRITATSKTSPPPRTTKQTGQVKHRHESRGYRLSPATWVWLCILLVGVLSYLIMAVITYNMPYVRSGDVIGPSTFGLWIMFGWMLTIPASGLVLAALALFGKLAPWSTAAQISVIGGLVVLPLLPAFITLVALKL